MSSNEDVDKEIEDPKKVKPASATLQVMDKVIRFPHQFDNEDLRESIVKIIGSLQDFQISRGHQTKITTFFTNK